MSALLLVSVFKAFVQLRIRSVHTEHAVKHTAKQRWEVTKVRVYSSIKGLKYCVFSLSFSLL